MADLHDDVMYESWGKSSAAGHRECMGNSKRVLRRSVSLLLGKTDVSIIKSMGSLLTVP